MVVASHAADARAGIKAAAHATIKDTFRRRVSARDRRRWCHRCAEWCAAVVQGSAGPLTYYVV